MSFLGPLFRTMGQTGTDINTAQTNIANQKAQQQKDQMDALAANLRLQQMRQQMAADNPEAQKALYQSQLQMQGDARISEAVRQHALQQGWDGEKASETLDFINQGKTPEEKDLRASIRGIRLPADTEKAVVVQNPGSPTGWAYQYKDGRMTMGAPPPSSTTKTDPIALEDERQKGRMVLAQLRAQSQQSLAQYRAGVQQSLAKLRNPTGTTPAQWQALNHDPAYIDSNKKLSMADGEIKRLSDILATGKDPTGKSILGGAELTLDKAQEIQSQISNQQAAAQDALKQMESVRNRVIYGAGGNGSGASSAPNATPARPKGVPPEAVWDSRARTWSMP